MNDLKQHAGTTGRTVADLARRNVHLIIALVAAVIFLYLLLEVCAGETMKLDSLAYSLFVEQLRSDSMTSFMQSFTGLLSIPILLVMAIAVAAFAPGRAPGYCVAGNLVGALVLNQLLKSIVQRPRPEGFSLITETGYSFPSGHSMISMAFLGLLIWLIWKYKGDRPLARAWCALLAVIIVLAGASRIYLGVHYASDVLAGFCVSLIWLAFYTHVIAPALLDERKGAPEAKSEDGV